MYVKVLHVIAGPFFLPSRHTIPPLRSMAIETPPPSGGRLGGGSFETMINTW